MSDTPRPGICIHGSLRRSCETCDLAERLEACERERDEAREKAERERDDARVEIDRLTNKLNTDSQHFELECRKAQIERLSQENDTLRALLIECREAYRRPWDFGFSARTTTDQRTYGAWLARLDAALGKEGR